MAQAFLVKRGKIGESSSMTATDYVLKDLIRFYEDSNSVNNRIIESSLGNIVFPYASYTFEICCKITGIPKHGSARLIEYGGAVISAENTIINPPGENSDFMIISFQYQPNVAAVLMSGPSATINNLNFGDIHTYTYTSDGATSTKLYFDGSLVGSVDTGVVLNRPSIYIMNASTDHPIAGQWYNVRGYKRVLTDEEIFNNYRIDRKNYNSNG